MADQSANCAGRLFLLEEDGVVDLTLWCHELEPMVQGRRPVEDWVGEHIRQLDEASLRELLGLPSTGNFQVLFNSTIRGFTVRPYDEYDEEIEFRDVVHEVIPEDYLQFLVKDPFATNEQEVRSERPGES